MTGKSRKNGIFMSWIKDEDGNEIINFEDLPHILIIRSQLMI